MPPQELSNKYGLPNAIKVVVKKGKNSFTAILPDYPGCITLGGSELELIANVTDAILTYFRVPREEAKKCNIVYVPQVLSAPRPDIKIELGESAKAFFLLYGNPQCYDRPSIR